MANEEMEVLEAVLFRLGVVEKIRLPMDLYERMCIIYLMLTICASKDGDAIIITVFRFFTTPSFSRTFPTNITPHGESYCRARKLQVKRVSTIWMAVVCRT